MDSLQVQVSSNVVERLRRRTSGYPRSLWALALGVLVLWTGRGMVVPFTVIYFTQIVGLSGKTVGAGIAAASLVGIVLVMFVAPQIDKRGGRPILVSTILIMAVATFASAFATSPITFVAAALVLYTASQSYWPAIDTVVTSVADPKRVIPAMSLIRVLMAMGVGFGGFLGGLIVSGGGLTEYRVMFSIGALLVLAGGLLIWRVVPNIKPETRNEHGETGSWADVFRDRWFLYAMLLLFALVLGFTQVQMSVPPFLRSEAGVGEGVIGALFLMNMLIVIVLQVPVAARVDRGNTGQLLAGTALIWSLAFTTMLLTPTFGLAAVGVFIFFTAGELIFMPASSILAVRLAPMHLRGRYFSLLSITWGGSFAIATLSAGAVLDTSQPMLLWPVMIAVMLACAVGALRLRGFARLRPANDDESANEHLDRAVSPAVAEALAD